MNDDYPVQFSVDYGDGTRNRLTTSVQASIMIIPIGDRRCRLDAAINWCYRVCCYWDRWT